MRPDGLVHADGPAILAGSDTPSLQVPDGFDIFSAQFSRDGDDLVIAANDSPPLTVIDYFTVDSPPNLEMPNGAMLTGDVVELLAGPRAPGQYAQADAPEGAESIGRVETMSGTSTATRVSGETVELAKGDPVFQGDVIETAGDSTLGLRLEDGTLASMASHSRLVLNEFVFETGGSDNWMLVNLVEGAFAFLTGAIAPSGGMEITTPVAVMAIRGTMPVAFVAGEGGATEFFAASDKDYELLHLTTREILGIVSSAAGFSLSSPDAPLEAIQLDPATLEEIDGLLDVLNDAAAELGLLGIQDESGFHTYTSFGSIDGNLAALIEFLLLLDNALAEEAVLEVEDPDQFLMAEAELVASPDQAATDEMSPVIIDVLDNDSHPDGDVLTVIFADVPNGQGSVTIVDGHYLVFDPGTDFDYLALGETTNVVITYVVADSTGAVASSTATVTLTGINQAPVIAPVGETSLDEQTDTQPLNATIAVTFTDVDLNNVGHEAAVVGVAVNGEAGGLTLDNAALMALVSPGPVTKNAGDSNGAVDFFFTAGSTVFDYLAEGEIVTLTYTVEIDDGDGGTTQQTFDVTITGTNDAPVIDELLSDVVATVVEDGFDAAGNPVGNPDASGQILASDVDNGVSTFSVAQPNGSFGVFAINAAGEWTYTLDDAAADHLALGQTRTEVFEVTVTDGFGATDQVLVTITVQGSNDAPGVSNISLAATEDGPAVVAGFIGGDRDSDDNTASLTYEVTQPDKGSVINNGDGTFSFDPGDDFQDLAAGDTRQVTFTYTATDRHGLVSDPATVTVTVTGTNDVPVISGVSTGAVTEDAHPTTLTTGGALTIVDPDAGQSSFVPQTNVAGTYGSFTLLADGTWSYSADNTQSAIQQLGAGEWVTDSFTAVSFDGTASETVTVTIHGTNDAPVITVGSGDSAKAGLTESDVGLQAQGTLSASDVDISDQVTATVEGVVATGNFSGEISIAALAGFLTVSSPVIADGNTAGTLTWVFNSGNEAFDFLAKDDRLVLTYTVQVDDGNGGTDTLDVVITITGTNDAPVIDIEESVVADTVVEAGLNADQNTVGDQTASGQIVADDLDNGAVLTYSVATAVGIYGAFSIDAATGAWTYTLDEAKADHLALGESQLEEFTVTVTDEHGATDEVVVTIDVIGSNDAPTTDDVSGLSGFAGTAIEITLSGSDVDGTVSFFKITTAPTDGGLFLDAEGLTPIDPDNILASGNEATIYFIPDSGVSGDVTFQYAAVDNHGAVDQTPATVEITVETAKFYLMIHQDTWQGGADLPTFQDFRVTIGGITYNLGDLTVVDSNYYQVDDFGFTLGVGTGSGSKERYVIFEIDGVPGGGSAEISFDYKVTDAQGESVRDGIRFYAGDTPDGMVLVYDGDEDPAFTGNQKNEEFSLRVLSFNYALVAGATIAIDDVELTAPLDPIVLDLGEQGFDLSGITTFDLTNDGQQETLAWTGGEDGILVMDIDGSGAIESGNEVFSPFFNGGGFDDALAALASLDTNGDGVIDAADEAFADLLVWIDANGDGVSQSEELFSLADLGIASLNLNADNADYKIDGQKVIADGQFTWDDGTIGNYVAVELNEIFASSEPLVSGDQGSELGAQGQLFALTDLSMDEVIIDYREGDVIDLTQLGFELATGQFTGAAAAEFVQYDPGTGKLFVDVDGAGGRADFELASHLVTTPSSILVRLTDGSTTEDVVIV
jgi:VCBS repeat-containing protein